jgi:protoheme IX farnesyltransferase
MWWDADIDAIMKRTVKRQSRRALYLREALGIGLRYQVSIVLLFLATNALAAGLLAF